jgi:hypothetical protein
MKKMIVAQLKQDVLYCRRCGRTRLERAMKFMMLGSDETTELLATEIDDWEEFGDIFIARLSSGGLIVRGDDICEPALLITS